MRQLILIKFILLIFCLSASALANSEWTHFPSGAYEVKIQKVAGIRADLLEHIAPVIRQSIANGKYPGAVVLVGHRGKIIYRGVFGHRRIVPDKAPMQFNTIFDIASLTKVVATTPAIMQLLEQGKIDLDEKVSAYWPAFAMNGKNKITVRELLTHTSGLPPEISIHSKQTKKNVLDKISKLKLQYQPGEKFLYSDVNFMVLAYLIEKISHESLDQYTANHIFKPLQMRHTQFTPKNIWRDDIAPTEIINKQLRWGVVHDPLAHSLKGVSGHAGLFSNANDLGIFAQSLLQGGYYQGKHFLGPLSIVKMTSPQTPKHISDMRGLGWDIDSRYSNRGVLFPLHSFGHTGWTGTSLWIDPVTQTWIVILTSRAHPKPAKNNQLVKDRRIIANIVSASIIDVSGDGLNNTGVGELQRSF